MRNRFQTLAITGATGLVGNNLLRLALEQGYAVRVLARPSPGLAEGELPREIRGLDVEVIWGDLQDPTALSQLCQGAELIVHAAAMVWIGHAYRDQMERVNVGGTRNICEAAQACGVKRLVHVSSVDALGFGSRNQPADENTAPRPEEGGVPYVDTKRAADQIVEKSTLDTVIVHPTLMLGANDWKPSSGKMLLAVAAGQAKMAPPGANNFVHVRDVVEALLAAAEGAPSKSRWILGNENLGYFEAWQRMARVIGVPGPWGTLPRWLGPLAVAATGLPRVLGFAEGEVNGAATRFGFLDHCFDSTRARRELGMKSTPLEVAVQDAWAFFQEKGM